MTSTVVYLGNLRNEATHLASNTVINTDAPVDNNGKGEAFSPTDLTATSLAACMMTILGILADRKGWDLRGMKADANKIMAANPRRIQRIEIRLQIPDATFSPEDRQIIENAAYTCPVALSLHPDIEQAIEFVYV